MENDKQIFLKRQKALADFGDFALQSEDLDEVLTEACRLVAEAMGTERAKVLQIEEDGRSLRVRAGVGWSPDVIGKTRMPLKERGSETFSIREGRPIIVGDIRTEDRFEFPEFVAETGVVALANVPIFLPGGRAFGLLQVDDTKPRDFTTNDSEFLRTYAAILGPIVDRLFKLFDLQRTEERFRVIVEEAKDYAIFTADHDGRITDWLPGAAAIFGWETEEIIGQSMAILFTPEDRGAGRVEDEMDTARRHGVSENARLHLRKDGSRVFIDGRLAPWTAMGSSRSEGTSPGSGKPPTGSGF